MNFCEIWQTSEQKEQGIFERRDVFLAPEDPLGRKKPTPWGEGQTWEGAPRSHFRAEALASLRYECWRADSTGQGQTDHPVSQGGGVYDKTHFQQVWSVSLMNLTKAK